VSICSTIAKHILACDRHETMFFTAGEHWSKVLLSLFAAHYSDFTCLWISSSSFRDVFIYTTKYFTWSKNCTRTPFKKHLMEQVVYTFLAKNNTELFCCNYKRLRNQQHSHHKYSEIEVLTEEISSINLEMDQRFWEKCHLTIILDFGLWFLNTFTSKFFKR